MLRLNRYILALILWVVFLFNVERLDYGSTEIGNIAPSTYIVVVAMIALGLMLPWWVRTKAWAMGTIAVLSFALVKFAGDRPVWGSGYTYISLFELGATLISAILAHVVGQLSADFVETARALLFADMAGRIYTRDEVRVRVKREMLYSRRANHPLSVLVIEADTENATVVLHETALEIQRLLVKRYSLVALERLLAWKTRRTDFILDESSQGRIVLVAPMAAKENAGAIISRLNGYAQRQLGVSLRYGVASFPDEEVTFEELVRRADQDLQAREYQGDSEIFVDGRDAGQYSAGVDGRDSNERRNARSLSHSQRSDRLR